MKTFMEWQIRFILEFQARAREKQNRPNLLLPLAFMVSGDTADRTKEFMKTNDNFGMVDEQIVFLHQNKVACFAVWCCLFWMQKETTGLLFSRIIPLILQ